MILEVDHVVPVCEGGSDDLVNLRTSCWECNRGKGGTPLLTDPGPDDPHLAAVMIAEREMQLREYHEIRARQHARENKQMESIWKNWERLCPSAFNLPSAPQLRTYLGLLDVQDILHAVEIVGEALTRRGEHQLHYSRALSYFYGILRRKVGPDAD